jgi:hypothetical protein
MQSANVERGVRPIAVGNPFNKTTYVGGAFHQQDITGDDFVANTPKIAKILTSTQFLAAGQLFKQIRADKIGFFHVFHAYRSLHGL